MTLKTRFNILLRIIIVSLIGGVCLILGTSKFSSEASDCDNAYSPLISTEITEIRSSQFYR